MTAARFRALSPGQRGYVVYLLGARLDEPHVPDEANPYPSGSRRALAWDEGARRACLHAQDVDDG